MEWICARLRLILRVRKMIALLRKLRYQRSGLRTFAGEFDGAIHPGHCILALSRGEVAAGERTHVVQYHAVGLTRTLDHGKADAFLFRPAIVGHLERIG